MNSDKPLCLYCQRDSDQTPLIKFFYQGESNWICPQHLPILIHEPHKLKGLLPGAQSLSPADTHDH